MSRKPGRTRSLDAYRAKRDADRTPEPFGSGALRPRLFVVQQHAARRLHWDFRLELGGVLLSWAIPRGPSLDPKVKRLAVQTEDHPLDYAEFEGVIPEGNYGAGAVIRWDLGRWIPVEDPEEGLEKGKLLFDLDGYKLHGRWTLVRTKGPQGASGKEWLLIKKADGHAREAPDDVLPDVSVRSGLTLDELRQGSQRAAELRRRLGRLKAPRRSVDAARLRPMLAERRDEPFSEPGWLFEVKYDGYRLIAAAEAGAARLYTRSGRDATRTYPEIAEAVGALPFRSLVLDGEVVVTDEQGRPHFERLQRRAGLTRARDVARASVELPVVYFVFDLLACEGFDLRELPLAERKALLEEILPAHGPLRYAHHFDADGKAVYAEIERLGFEGMLAKRADSPYRAGQRSPAWQKVRIRRSEDFVIVGFTAPRGTRTAIGALHLAAYADDALVYAGRVGSGLPERLLAELREELEALRRDTPPCAGPVPQTRGNHWVEPRLVCEVRFAEVTSEGLLRQPVFLRLRDDKDPRECLHPRREPPPEAEILPAASAPRAADATHEVPFTNLDKVFWPREGYTKGDLIEYYRAISPWLLPYLADRPLVLTRHPDGIEGKSFFQKDAPTWVPDWLRTERMWSEHAGREIGYFVCDDVESLLYVVNLGTIPLHVWSSRGSDLAHPDWCILDLDPKGAPFAHVARVARAIRALCEEIGLPTFVKSSGSAGLHVLVPLARRMTYEQSRTLGELIARSVVAELPQIATTARRLSAREGRVYVDFLQNGHGRLLASPLCVRPLPGAPVSMPLRWREVSAGLRIERFTIANAVRRMQRLGEDPLAPVLHTESDLLGALGRLAERLGS